MHNDTDTATETYILECVRVGGEAWTQVVHGTTSAAPRQAHEKHALIQEKQAGSSAGGDVLFLKIQYNIYRISI